MTDYELASEYHRGYEDGLAARDIRTYQLDTERRKVAARLRALRFRGDGSHANFSRVFAAIMGRPFPWTRKAVKAVCDELARLLDGGEMDA